MKPPTSETLTSMKLPTSETLTIKTFLHLTLCIKLYYSISAIVGFQAHPLLVQGPPQNVYLQFYNDLILFVLYYEVVDGGGDGVIILGGRCSKDH